MSLVQLKWEGDAGSIQINGTDYFLDQGHWHSPSEHSINGRRSSLSLSLMCQCFSLFNNLRFVWIPLTTENWKHCNKIIFKYVNSDVRSIFNENFAKKKVCGSRKQYTRPTHKTLDTQMLNPCRYPHVHLICIFFSLLGMTWSYTWFT